MFGDVARRHAIGGFRPRLIGEDTDRGEAAVVAGIKPRLRPERRLGGILRQMPQEWLTPEEGFAAPEAKRAGYVDYLVERATAAPLFVEEAMNARARLL